MFTNMLFSGDSKSCVVMYTCYFLKIVIICVGYVYSEDSKSCVKKSAVIIVHYAQAQCLNVDSQAPAHFTDVF